MSRTVLCAGAAALLPEITSAQEQSTKSPASFGANRHYPSNRAPLAATPFVPLPLGAIRPRGWLQKQLELQRDGLTGHAEELLPAAKGDSAWLGGGGEDWEKGPYYVKGLIPLAYALGDEGLKAKAQKWIEGILGSQREDGFFGPKKNDDWWPRMVATYLLRDYHEATGDARVVPFLTRYYQHMERALPGRHLRDWGRARAGDEIDTIFWLYNRTGDEFLLRVADLLHAQAYDWTELFRENTFLYNGGEMVSHNVNVPQAMKMPPVWWQRSQKAEDREALAAGERNLQREHGFPIGINSGTEHLAGRSPSQGVETCSIVEKMLSVETALRIFGEAELGDTLETLAFNALPGALSKPIKQHVYYSRPNNVTAITVKSGFEQDYADGTVPSPMSGFPCCCYNLHMGWPKFAQNCWAATHDQGLAVFAYAPCEVQAKVGEGTEIRVIAQTNYPFEETIRLTIKTPQQVEFPLQLRIPAWCEAPSVRVGEEVVPGAVGGEFLRILRKWSDGDVVTLDFPMRVRTVAGINASVSVVRGPLIFTLDLEERRHVTRAAENGFDQYEVLSESPWNYALAIPTASAEPAFAVQRAGMPENPFDPAVAPIRLIAKGRRLPDWRMAWNGAVAFDPPLSPVTSTEPEQKIALLPYGARYLRVTSFPVLGEAEPRPPKFEDDFSAGWTAWNVYGGGWYIENGLFRCTPRHAGGKALIARSHFTDLEAEVDVAVGATGNAGLIFRASDFGTGPNDYRGYYVGIDAGAGAVLAGKAAGRWTEIRRVPAPLESGRMTRLRIAAKGARVQVYLGGAAEPVLEFTDSDHIAGAVGLRQYLPDARTGLVQFARFSAAAI